MRPLSASECITPSIERTKSLLFRPFQWQAFLKLTAVAFFAEILGGGFSFSSPMQGKTPGVPTPAQGMIVALLFVVGLVVLVIGLVLLYFGSRLQLVLVEIVATGQTTIAPIWRRYSRLTWRWVGLKLLFFLVVGLILFAALAPVMISMFKNMPHDAGSPPPAAFFSHIALFLSAMFVGVLVFLTAYFLLRDLALPFLAFEHLSIAQTLSRLRSVITAAPGEVALYVLFRFLLGLGAAIGAEILILLVLLVSLIPFALIGGVLWLALHHAGSIGTAALIASAIVGGLVLLVWMACVFVGLLGTVLVFTQSYALYFLGGHYPLLSNFLEPPQFPNSTPPLSSTPPDSEGTPPLRNNPSPI